MLPTPKKFYGLLFVIAFWTHLVFGQNPLALTNISTADGLSQGMVYCMIQDKDGFLWIGTKDGLNRYDGYSFKVFNNEPHNKYSIPGNNVLAISEDSKGRLWIRTDNDGICIYDKYQSKFHRVILKNQHENKYHAWQRSIPILELPDGRFMVNSSLTEGFHIFSLPNDFFTHPKPINSQWIAKPNLANGTINTMVQGSNKTIYLSYADTTLFVFDSEQMKFDLMEKYWLYNATPLSNGNLWTTSIPSLLKWNRIYPIFTQSNGLINSRFLHQDQQSRLWLGTIDSLYCLDIKNWQPGLTINFYSSILRQYKTNSESINGFIDKSGVLWISRAGYGLDKIVTSTTLFQNLGIKEPLNPIQAQNADNKLIRGSNIFYENLIGWKINQSGIEKLLPRKAFNIYWHSKTGDYWEIDKMLKRVTKIDKQTSNKAVFNLDFPIGTPDIETSILETSSGKVLIGCAEGQIVQIDPNKDIINYFQLQDKSGKKLIQNGQITTIYQDTKGLIWVGSTNGFGILKLNDNENSLQSIQWHKSENSNQNSLSYNYVSSFLVDPLDTSFIWIATKGGGINRYQKSTGLYLNLSTKEGLPNKVVYSLLPDKKDNIWGSTNKGLFCLITNKSTNSKNWQIKNFNNSDGIAGEEFNTDEYFLMANGKMAFGGVDGTTIFNPEEVLDNNFEPKVFITKLLLGNQNILPNDNTGILTESIEFAKSIHLNYQQNNITFEFSALDFRTPSQNKYRYQMVGVDDAWVEAGTRRTATYLHLPAGTFTFKVQGSNSQGIWSHQIAEIKVIVSPPWWRTWWAYIFYAILIFLFIRGIIRFYAHRTKLRTQLKYEQIEAHRIKELDTAKTQLYTNITHEFRTPLTVIIGMTEQMQSNPNAMEGKGLDMILRNSKNLLDLVNEMLDLSKLETGKMHLHFVKGDLINFIQYLVESFQSLTQSQHKQLHLLLGPEELWVMYDPEKLRQILSNLLSNAIKFTPENGNIYITVNQLTAKENPNEVKVEIIVRDTGIGIAEGQLEQIFDRFYQVEGNIKNKSEGTGIGLALTKELVKLLGGTINVKSNVSGNKKGTEFTVVLPFTRPETVAIENDENGISYLQNTIGENLETPQNEDESSGEGAQQRPLVLLVEDHPDVVAYIASCLTDYRLAVAKDGAEGLEIASEIVPDLIISDVMMPIMDGLELCQKIRKQDITCHIPIILLTAKAGLESKLEGLEYGADAYIEKPFDPKELLVRIKKLLEQRKLLQQYYLNSVGIIITQNYDKINPSDGQNILPNVAEDPIINKVKECIESNLDDETFTIEKLCKMVFMSYSQLYRKLEATIGYTPNKLIRSIRLNKAIEMLTNTQESIATIATQCGFIDPGYFSRIFKKEFGMSPQDWRIANQK